MSDASEPQESQPVVVLVDDEPDLLDLLEDYLQGQGFRIHLCSNGHVAKRLLQELEPDAVVTDLMMPGISGLEVLEATRKRDADISVLILTGYASLESSIDALDRGAVGYLMKPIRKLEFNLRVRDAIAQTRLRRERSALLVDLAAATFKLQAVFDTVEQGLILVSDDGLVESINAAAARMIGGVPDEIEGALFQDLLGPACAELVDAITVVQRTRGRVSLKERTLASARAPRAVFDATVGPVDTPDGPSGVLVALSPQTTGHRTT